MYRKVFLAVYNEMNEYTLEFNLVNIVYFRFDIFL